MQLILASGYGLWKREGMAMMMDKVVAFVSLSRHPQECHINSNTA
jgi:hypothetical protein